VVKDRLKYLKNLKQKVIEVNTKIFLWNPWHNGDIMSQIVLILQIKKQFPEVEVHVGCYRNHAYLFADIGVEKIHIHNNDDRNALGIPFGTGAQISDDLSYLCPEDCIPILTWLGQYEDTKAHTWESQCEVFNRACLKHNLNIALNPNVDANIAFKKVPTLDTKPVAVWVENGPCRSMHNQFSYDLKKIADLFKSMNFYTTGKPNIETDNVFDCSHYNLIEHSNLSNKCDIILGKGSGPYFCTFTYENKFKPRAIVGYDLQNHLPFWNYSGSKMVYLSNEDELIDYLRNV
jgi:hypothetical protein